MHRIVSNRYINVSTFYIYVTILLIVVSGMYSIFITGEGKCSIRNSYAIFAVQAVILTIYRIGSTRYHQIILGHDSMSGGILDRKTSTAAQCEITFGKYDSVHIVVISLYIVA